MNPAERGHLIAQLRREGSDRAMLRWQPDEMRLLRVAANEIERLSTALDWIEAEPEDPIKVQLWARAALGQSE